MTASAPSGARYGVTSMVAPLRRVLVRRPATTGDWDGAGWRTPDATKLERQHEAFVELLDGLGVEVEVADTLDGQVDSVYMHDPLIMSGRGGIPLNMAKPARMREPGHAQQEFERLDVPVLGTLDGDAYADGGDRFWLDDKTAAIGLGYRTNRKGAQALQALLEPEGIHVETYDMPHDEGPAHVLHLQSFLSGATEDLFVVYEPLAPVRLLTDIRERGIDWIAIDRESYSPWAGTSWSCGPGSWSWSTACPRCAARWSSAAWRSTSTTAPICRSRATAAPPASPPRCSVLDWPDTPEALIAAQERARRRAARALAAGSRPARRRLLRLLPLRRPRPRRSGRRGLGGGGGHQPARVGHGRRDDRRRVPPRPAGAARRPGAGGRRCARSKTRPTC